MTAIKDRAELVELMAHTHHNVNLGHIVKWEDKTDTSFSLILAASVLDAIEAAGCAVVPVEPTQDMLWAARWRTAGPSDTVAVLRVAIDASPYRKEPQP